MTGNVKCLPDVDASSKTINMCRINANKMSLGPFRKLHVCYMICVGVCVVDLIICNKLCYVDMSLS